MIIGVDARQPAPAGRTRFELQATRRPQASGSDRCRPHAAAVKPLGETLVELIPRNPIESAVRALDGDMLPLMVFALIFGVAVSAAAAEGATAERS